MPKPFLLLQLRPEDEAADDEYEAFLRAMGLDHSKLSRIRMEESGLPTLNLDDFSGVIMGGGPSNVSDDETKKPDYQKRFEAQLPLFFNEVIEKDFPYFGECYGLGALARHLGAKVGKEKYSENVAPLTIELTDEGMKDPLLEGLPQSFRAYAGHKESCLEIPKDAALLASSPSCPVHIIRYKENIYASQFHPELDSYGLEVRINVYKHAGYFPPEDADRLIEEGHRETITVPAEILRRFVLKYQL